ncbi:MAG: hypothetical protein KUG79_11380 [Pseudomonadales bacterium]|nr:hypothetical protein [Pseudomonadales bacterium]
MANELDSPASSDSDGFMRSAGQLLNFGEAFCQNMFEIADVELTVESQSTDEGSGFHMDQGLWAYVELQGTRSITLGVHMQDDTLANLSSHIGVDFSEQQELVFDLIREVLNTTGGSMMSSFRAEADILTLRSPGIVQGKLRCPKVPFVRLNSQTSVGVISFIICVDEARQLLQRLYDKSEEVNQAKDAFLSVMSHELRTPLNSIIGFSSIVTKKLEVNSRLHNMMNSVNSSARELRGIVDIMFDIATIEAGTFSIDHERIDIIKIVQEAYKQSLAAAGTKNLEFCCDCNQLKDMFVEGDTARVRQMILILVSNAIKFTEQGSVFIAINAVSVDKQPWVAVKVTDTGIGMSEVEISEVFCKFSKVDNRTNREYCGVGLSLALTKELMQFHRGSIEVVAALGKGSAFTLNFPLQVAANK